MGDIVQQLRGSADSLRQEGYWPVNPDTLIEAADEIERLRAELQRLARELDACEGHLDVVSTGTSNTEVPDE